jgi:uncharacterized membrane protein YraQ (UPF0718 family)
MKAKILSLVLASGFGVVVPACSQTVAQDTKDAVHDSSTAVKKGTKKSTSAVKKGYKKSTHATKTGVNKAANKVADKTTTN